MKQADIVKDGLYDVKVDGEFHTAQYDGHDKKNKKGRFTRAVDKKKLTVPYQHVWQTGEHPVKAVKPKPRPSPNKKATKKLQEAIAGAVGEFKDRVQTEIAVQEANGHAEQPKDANEMLTPQMRLPPGVLAGLLASFDRLFGSQGQQQRERRFPRRGDMVAALFHKECVAAGGALDIDDSGTLIEQLLALDANGWRSVHAKLYDQDSDFRTRFLPPAPAYV